MGVGAVVWCVLAIAIGGCASAQNNHQRVTIEAQGIPHSGHYDTHGLWHGGFYDAERRYHEDDPKWGMTHDPDWNAKFSKR